MSLNREKKIQKLIFNTIEVKKASPLLGQDYYGDATEIVEKINELVNAVNRLTHENKTKR